MIAVIFEVQVKPGQQDSYLDLAKALADDLKTIEGFIGIERFQSLANPDKLLSLSYWQNEKALTEWRNRTNHRNAQAKGRDEIFSDYTLRIASVIRAYGMDDRDEAPSDSRHTHG